MRLFAALDGISPWWWVAAAILLAALEMVTLPTVLIWSAGAAMLTAIALWIWPALPGTGQLAIFGVLSIAFTFAGRSWVARYGYRADGAKRLNRRAQQLIGREADVVSFAHGEGLVKVDGVPWPARLDGPGHALAAGDRVRVVAADGIVVWVRPV
jgi:membrane protein implicated in regulation of membrane protease activity